MAVSTRLLLLAHPLEFRTLVHATSLQKANTRHTAQLCGDLVAILGAPRHDEQVLFDGYRREDVDDKRYFWSREIYVESRYGGGFSCQEEMSAPPEGTRWDPDVK
ncbi:hypothetical protein GGX14DRAFT_679013 [Mycena pura]|uniref:Uncharacterized protein n=1 Tax=Mycena pura TaxID=153505 RepID=A0AAD6V0R0_9AGAR|nr:hypothetical protein GGX14DRAFT_679013 [Mycena pura]